MKRLIIDMDEVLADTSKKIIEIFNKQNNQNVDEEFFKNNDFYSYTHQDQFIPYMDELYKPGFFADLAVFPDAPEVVEELYKKYDIYIVSAATQFPYSLKEKHDWLNSHFPFIPWQKMVFCGSKSIVHGDIMIDDHAENFVNFNGEKLLYDSPHNYGISGFRRVKNWKEIYEILK